RPTTAAKVRLIIEVLRFNSGKSPAIIEVDGRLGASGAGEAWQVGGRVKSNVALASASWWIVFCCRLYHEPPLATYRHHDPSDSVRCPVHLRILSLFHPRGRAAFHHAQLHCQPKGR